MKSFVATIILLVAFAATALATSVALQWDPNTESDLAGYRVFYVAESSTFEGAVVVDVKNQTTATIADLDPLKSYSFAVKAYNTAGMESAFSNVVVVPELTPPVVALTAPTITAGSFTVYASATDNAAVTKVEFYVNGQLVTTAASPPYVYARTLASLATGTCTITVKAYGAAGNVGTASRTITIPAVPVAPKRLQWDVTIAPTIEAQGGLTP